MDGHVNNEKRLGLAKAFFDELTPDESLVFHYANYSNPLSTELLDHFRRGQNQAGKRARKPVSLLGVVSPKAENFRQAISMTEK